MFQNVVYDLRDIFAKGSSVGIIAVTLLISVPRASNVSARHLLSRKDRASIRCTLFESFWSAPAPFPHKFLVRSPIYNTPLQ